MSWESSAEYYRLANELVRERLGDLHSARCVLASLDFADVERLQVAGRWDEAGQLLAEAAKGLEAAVALSCCCCAPTPCTSRRPGAGCRWDPAASPGRRPGAGGEPSEADQSWADGTAFTVEQDFYRDRIAAGGLTVLIPPIQDRAEVHRIIYEE